MRMLVALMLCATFSFAHAETPAEGAPGKPLFTNSDFELGTLENWRVDGDAFVNQPTRGDNVKVRNEKRTANHHGNYWVGSYENYQGKDGQKPGASQGDKPTGSLLSESFIIERPFITFLVGGGTEDKASVQLIVRGEIVRIVAGKNDPKMTRVIWDVREYLNEKAMLHLVDRSGAPYGILNADDFRYYETGASRLLFPNSDFEACTLSGWTAEGDAFEKQPIKGDNVAIRTGGKRTANQQGLCWIGTLEAFNGQPGQEPGAVQGDLPTGVLRSQTFTIDGEKILFRIGGGNARNVGVRLMVGDKAVRVSRGQRQPEMTMALWDVSPWKGQPARIEIFDNNTKPWGFINADDFRYGGVDAEVPVVPGAPMEAMTLPESLHNTNAPEEKSKSATQPSDPNPAPPATPAAPKPEETASAPPVPKEVMPEEPAVEAAPETPAPTAEQPTEAPVADEPEVSAPDSPTPKEAMPEVATEDSAPETAAPTPEQPVKAPADASSADAEEDMPAETATPEVTPENEAPVAEDAPAPEVETTAEETTEAAPAPEKKPTNIFAPKDQI